MNSRIIWSCHEISEIPWHLIGQVSPPMEKYERFTGIGGSRKRVRFGAPSPDGFDTKGPGLWGKKLYDWNYNLMKYCKESNRLPKNNKMGFMALSHFRCQLPPECTSLHKVYGIYEKIRGKGESWTISHPERMSETEIQIPVKAYKDFYGEWPENYKKYPDGWEVKPPDPEPPEPSKPQPPDLNKNEIAAFQKFAKWFKKYYQMEV
jgi:hypothetical protein